jgi:hypothetical protein
MKVERIGIDSQVLGGNVLAVQDFDPALDFVAFERDYIEAYHPVYVSAKIPLERISDVQALESGGFQLAECQIRSMIKLGKPYDVSPYPYEFDRVVREEDLAEVLDIAATTFVHDRFSVDRSIDPAVSGARYREYVRQSFHARDEAVYRLVDRDGRTVAFKTHRYVSSTEVLFLLCGVHSDYKNLGLGLINEYSEFNELIRKGIRKGITHISATNYPIFNLEIAQLGFRVLTTFAVMRKIYSRDSGDKKWNCRRTARFE